MSEVVFKLHLNIEVKTFRSLVLNSGKIAIKCLIGQTRGRAPGLEQALCLVIQRGMCVTPLSFCH